MTDVGGLNDGGFNQFSHAGYEKARQQYGFPDVVIQSQVISNNEYLKNITAAAQQADMVIGVGFLMQNAMDRVARQFPNKKFALITHKLREVLELTDNITVLGGLPLDWW